MAGNASRRSRLPAASVKRWVRAYSWFIVAISLLVVSIACERLDSFQLKRPTEPPPKPTSSNPRSNYDKYFEVKRKAPPLLTLPRTQIYGLPDSFGQPVDLVVVDHRILVLDALTVSGISIVDRQDGTIADVQRSRSKSTLTPASITRGDDKKFWFYYSDTGDWLEVDIEALGPEPTRAALLPDGLSEFVRVSEDRIIATGIFAGELLRLYDLKNGGADFVVARGAVPFASLTPDLAIHINRTRLAAHPSDGQFVLAFRYLSRLHVFDSNGNLVRAFAGPEEVELRYDVVYDSREGIDRLVRNNDTRLAYLDVAAGEDKIFALFSGRRNGDHPETASFGSKIHVFTWDGRFIGACQLEEDIYGIEFDSIKEVLLGIRGLPFPAIVEFSLDPITTSIEAREKLSGDNVRNKISARM